MKPQGLSLVPDSHAVTASGCVQLCRNETSPLYCSHHHNGMSEVALGGPCNVTCRVFPHLLFLILLNV